MQCGGGRMSVFKYATALKQTNKTAQLKSEEMVDYNGSPYFRNKCDHSSENSHHLITFLIEFANLQLDSGPLLAWTNDVIAHWSHPSHLNVSITNFSAHNWGLIGDSCEVIPPILWVAYSSSLLHYRECKQLKAHSRWGKSKQDGLYMLSSLGEHI